MKCSISTESELKDLLYSTGRKPCLYWYAHTVIVHSRKEWHMRSPSAIHERRPIRAASCQRTAVIASEPTEQGWSDACGELHVGPTPTPSGRPRNVRKPRACSPAENSSVHTPHTLRASGVWGMRRNQAFPAPVPHPSRVPSAAANGTCTTEPIHTWHTAVFAM
jgi:hypothetical protein